MSTIRLPGIDVLIFGVFALFFAGFAKAQVEPDKSGVGQAEFHLDALTIDNQYRLPADLPDQAAANARADLNALGIGRGNGRVDRRSGRWASLIMTRPLIPGRGVGNRLGWADVAQTTPANPGEIKAAANAAFHRFLKTHSAQLRIDLNELPGRGRTTLHRDGEVIQLYMPRVVNGIKVRGSYLTATINNGNLVLFGTQHWGDIDVSTSPRLGSDVAAEAVAAHVTPYLAAGTWGKTDLVLVPVARGSDVARVPVGKGYSYRLAWVVRPAFKGDVRRFEALVDAHSGELISFEDTNHYAASAREVRGGVYPVSNDGIVPDGVEQTDWPMPFINVSTPDGNVVTDSGGNLPAPVDGEITAGLSGQYVLMSDYCGPSSLSSEGDIDFGESSGTDCANPGFGGLGNTHASRTGFYELNRIMEMARGQLPGNSWLQQQLKATMNITNSCNAFWNGVTVNFYQSGGGCSNTGELAGVFDHEWGHGIDDNDAVPTIASPSGEGIADIYTALRLNDSCIGRNFRSTNCTGNGDACLSCTGVRDIDYLKRVSGDPHTYTWSNETCGSSVHCIGAVYSEAVWSLWKRKLQSAPYNYDNNTAHEIVNRLTFIGGGNTGTWFSGGPPYGGCAAGSGYLNYLAADDDDGDLGNGTPHMQAIYAAFNDQEIACNTPAVQGSGCSDVPTTAPAVSASPLDKSVNLNWDPVSGAAGYEVFRTDGVFACDFGKIKVGETIGTSFDDSGLQNGRDYSYVVIPKGSSDACFGPASACTTGAPAAGPNVAIDDDSAVLATSGGDGDEFIDNCESGTLSFDIDNTGLGNLTNVRITAVDVISHAGTTVTTFSPVAESLVNIAEGGSTAGSFDFIAGGLAFGDTLVFEVTLTADQISPVTKTQTLSLQNAETDRQSIASKTWDFESDADGWTVIEGTFDRQTPGGANGSSAYLASSANADNQCDHVRSPVVRLTASSTLTLSNQYDIEGFYTPTNAWYDRANVGIHDEDTKLRTAIDPDGGRLYNAGGINGTCGTSGQNGWADSATSWGQSSWSATALGSAAFAGKRIQIDVRYGTDPSLNGFGFRFDQVTLTDVELLVADAQNDNCGPPASDPPLVEITAPGNSTYLQGDSVTFEGTANDDVDGVLSDSLSWTSDLDGAIGSDASFSTSTLSVGTHTITAEATDSDGGTGSDQVTVTIDNVDPTVTITAPGSSSFSQGDSVTFQGEADDPEGDLSASLSWTSSRDGFIGSDASFSTSTLSVGTHTITADVTDSNGGTGSDQVTVTINNVPPTVSITSPADGASFGQGVNVSFAGSADDPEGDLSAGLGWTSSLDGDIGTGASFSTTSLSVGTHTITAGVTDSNSGTGSDSISIEITEPAANSVRVESVVTSTVNASKGQKYGVATVTIVDNTGPVAGYDVSGHFGAPFDGEGTKTMLTNESGVATFQTDSTAKGPTVTFCVSDVSGGEGALPYDPTANAPGTTCGEEPPPPTGDPTDVHVASVTTGSSGVGGGDKVGTATVLVVNNLGNPAVGYTVTGDFGGDFSDTDRSAVTGADGTAVVTTAGTGRGRLTVTFCVTGVSNLSEGALPYDPNDNAVTCGP